MFLNRVGRAFGRLTQPRDDSPRIDRGSSFGGKVRLDDVMPVSSPRLAELFLARHRGGGDGVRTDATEIVAAGFAQAFDRVDPLPIAIELTKRLPLKTIFCRTENNEATQRLSRVFDNAVEQAWKHVQEQHGDVPPIGPADLETLLAAVAILVAGEGVELRWGKGLCIPPIVRAAASRPGPEMRRALIQCFSRCFTDCYNVQTIAALVETLLALTDIDPLEVPQMAKIAQHAARMDGIRAQVLAEAGPVLAPAVEAVLDANSCISDYSLSHAEKHPAMAAVTDQSPEERGGTLQRMLRLIADPSRFGVAKWGELERRNGRYMIAMTPSEQLTGFGNIIAALASRKVALPDPDGDVALLLKVLPWFHTIAHKKVLNLILDTVAAHPSGRATAELRAICARTALPRLISENSVRVVDVLRGLQPATAAPAAEAPAAPRGFGRKGLASPAPETSPLAGLASLALPDLGLATYATLGALSVHFDNLFEARLYDRPHREFLSRLAKLDTWIKAQPANGQDFDAGFRAAAIGLGFSKDQCAGSPRRNCSSEIMAVGADLDARFSAFAPFVMADPERARRIAGLAADLGGKSAPPKKWLEAAREIFADIDEADHFALIDALTSSPSPTSMQSANESHLRTILYLSPGLDPQRLGPKLANYALKQCYVTLPGVGIRSEKLGNACLWALAAMPEGAGVPYLARILARTKYPKIKAKIDAALNEAATAAGIARGELDEITVPTHELDRDGLRRVPFAEGEAVLRVDGNDVEIDWFNEQGKPLKAPSTAMKADKALLNQVRADAKELAADLSIQPQRLQRLYLEARDWPAEAWRSRYLDHPLLRGMVRRLVWWVEGADGARVSALPDATGEGLCDVAGRSVALEGATIRPWHPIDDTPDNVEAWRDRLEALEITQPFAQAWREIYALTDAERATGTYSNRWAAHILRQHQAMTLARLNGWRVTHRMWVDAANDEPWHLTLPAHGLVADYWVNGAGGDDPEVTDSNAYVYVATDRVQFHAIVGEAQDSARGPARGRAVPLEEVPPAVFSEIMRQADLFTAVASIAADPNWLDRGGDAAHPSQWGHAAADYWNRTNTAELEESGKRRRAMLERIVPRLKIAGQLGFEDRYLTVEGKRHRYRIHLGSGASFRGERHICIVSKNDAQPGRIWLPFEGDRTLSIVLSKAVLLAADDKITDPVILAQL